MMKTILIPQTTVTTQTVLASTLLRLAAAEMDGAVKRELAENPALEVAEPYWQRKRARGERLSAFAPASSWEQPEKLRATLAWQDDDQDPVERLTAVQTPREALLSQARLNVPDAHLEIVCQLVQLLDEQGFLRSPEAALARELGVSVERILEGIAWLQKLDPPGIGARDLRECFLLQCAHLAARGIDCALIQTILASAWEFFSRQEWEMVAKKAKLSRAQIESALQFIRENLYPYPLALLGGGPEHALTLTRPDLIVHRLSDAGGAVFRIEVVAAEMHHLRISDTYQLALSPTGEAAPQLAAHQREAVRQAVERARGFIDAMEQRWATLRQIGEFVVDFQQAFFAYGPAQLKPLTRAVVANQLGLHESTISRAVSDKVLQLPTRQLIELSDLFDRSLAAKEAIRHLVQAPGKPLSDREIAEQLQEQSFCIARRTVAKYRAQLGISTMGQRQGWLQPAG